MSPDTSKPEALGTGSLCSKVFHPSSAQIHPLVSDLSQTTLLPSLPTSIPLPDGNLVTRQGELPETPGNPVGALQAGVDADNELQRDEAAWTHILSGNPALSMDNFKIQLEEILHFWVTISYLPPKLKERPLHFHSAHCNCLKLFLTPKALLDLVSSGL